MFRVTVETEVVLGIERLFPIVCLVHGSTIPYVLLDGLLGEFGCYRVVRPGGSKVSEVVLSLEDYVEGGRDEEAK